MNDESYYFDSLEPRFHVKRTSVSSKQARIYDGYNNFLSNKS